LEKLQVYNLLVPLFGANELSLNAVNFAVHFAERSSANPVFVRFKRDMSGKIAQGSPDHELTSSRIMDLIKDYLVEDMANEEHWVDLSEYELEICRLVKNHDITEIVLSAPDSNDLMYRVFLEFVESLKQTTNCRIITVKGLTKKDMYSHGS
jgi:hypothetical protein